MADTSSVSNGTIVKREDQYQTQGYGNGRFDGRSSYGQQYTMPTQAQTNVDMAYLTQNVAAMNFQGSSYTTGNRPGSVSAPSNNYGGYNIPTAYWPASGPLAMGAHQAYNLGTPQSAAMYTPNPSHLPYGHHRGHNNSPMSHGWTPGNMMGEVPALRRESMSSAGNDTPGTPNYATFQQIAHNGVAIVNRSPSGTFTASTPSPLQMVFPSMGKGPDADNIEPRLKIIVTKDPPIPSAIPAPSSPLKPLDRALENPRGETNVYIRGLMPETSDDMLENWGRRFGDIKSSKSIIDHNTGMCKGFGFVRFHNYEDAEDCIRGFHHLGYEVSFARESFYSKLKAIADDSNTNLYVSNLPKSMNEHELANIFAPHKVCSARILRNSNGTGRGVGFARFEGRTDCEEIIRVFNNKVIEHNGEEHTIQIRYADTQEQKHLKQTTAAARQFRSAEYEYATLAHRQGYGRAMSSISGSEAMSPSSNDFENFLSHNASLAAKNYGEPNYRQYGQRTPLGIVSPSNNNIRRNRSMSINSTPLAKVITHDSYEGGVALRGENATPAIAHGDSSPSRVRAADKVMDVMKMSADEKDMLNKNAALNPPQSGPDGEGTMDQVKDHRPGR
ncbi:RNA recognition motif-containing protein 15 [Elsinoe fawcettii]|nr:RNA recognition motif-containing protein 15 [Elsinoe fawcettii]